jgi:hypothetical protein
MKTAEYSSSKTFQKGDDYGELIEWFMKQIETNDYQPEGTEWSGGEPAPYDPVCELKHKYRIVILKTIESPDSY